MSDIFLSYANEALERVQVLADALEDRGWSVWWDRRIPIGQSFDSVIQRELDAARAVVVVWTHDAVVSRWVRSEAERAAKQGKALPVVMDNVQLPLGASLLQTADLSDWRGETNHAGFQRLVEQLTEQLSDLQRHPRTRRRKGRRIQRVATARLAVGLLLLVLVALVGSLSLLRASEARIEMEIVTNDLNFVSATQQDLIGLLVTSRLSIAGVRRLQIPRSRTTPTKVINAEETQGIFVTLNDFDSPAAVAAMTLESLPLNDGTAVRLFFEADEPDVNISLDGGPFRFQVNLQGQVELFLSKEVHERLDFGSPKPMQIDTVRNGVAVHLDPVNIHQRLNPEPLSVSTLGLYRIEERLVGQQTRVRKISTIISGRLAIAEAFTFDRQLPRGTTVALNIVKGAIEDIRFFDNRLQLRFRGSVAKLELCEEKQCDNLMPNYLERLIRLLW